MDTYSFIVHVEIEDIYQDNSKDIKKEKNKEENKI